MRLECGLATMNTDKQLADPTKVDLFLEAIRAKATPIDK